MHELNVLIQRATTRHLPAIFRLANHPHLLDAKGRVYKSWIAAFIQQKQIVLVAIVQNKVVGFTLGERLIDHGCIRHLTAVDRHFQHHGIGNQLIDAFEHEARRRRMEWIVTYASLDSAPIRKLLHSRGYDSGVKVQEELKIISKKAFKKNR